MPRYYGLCYGEDVKEAQLDKLNRLGVTAKAVKAKTPDAWHVYELFAAKAKKGRKPRTGQIKSK